MRSIVKASTVHAASGVFILAAVLGGPGCAPQPAVQTTPPHPSVSLACCEPILAHVQASMEAAEAAPQEDANTSTASISLIQEVDMGDEFSRNIEMKFDVHRSPHVEEIFAEVVVFADRPSLSYDVRVLGGTEQLNAFSIPGGRLYITDAFMEALELTDGELAFVIGHEVAHAALRHIPSHMESAYADYYSRVMICQAALAGQVEATSVVPTFQILDLMQSITSVGREFEADQYGALYAMQAGYPFSDAISALKKIRKLLGEQSHFGTAYGDVADRLSGSIASLPTHPPTSQRLEQLDRFRNQIIEVIERADAASLALDEGDYGRASLDLANALKVFPESESLRLNLALADHLIYRDTAPPGDRMPGTLTTPQKLEIEWRNVAMRSGSTPDEVDEAALERAMAGYRETLARDSEHPLARNNLGVAFLDVGDVDQAIVELTRAVAVAPEFSTAHKNLAVAYCHKLALVSDTAAPEEVARLVGLARSSWEAFAAWTDGDFVDDEVQIRDLVGAWGEKTS